MNYKDEIERLRLQNKLHHYDIAELMGMSLRGYQDAKKFHGFDRIHYQSLMYALEHREQLT